MGHSVSCLVVFALAGCLQQAFAQADIPGSERDYLDDVPVVLSVSRLAQRLDETPAAVTVLDRAAILSTGVRDVADLLRYVPGFRVSTSFEMAPRVSYHNNLSDYANRAQVMVDGRSVYSPFFLGSTGPGLQTVAIDDIERIEVIRGSNAAAYGARAFLGMINIVTRDTAQTIGTAVQVARGDNGVKDTLLRVGLGAYGDGFRLTVDQRSDLGLSGAGGLDRVNRVNLRKDVQATANDRLEFRLGQFVIASGVGFADGIDDGLRTRWVETSFAQIDWQHILSADSDLAFQYSHTIESIQDRVQNTEVTDVTMDLSGRASIDAISMQHTARVNPNLRVVWGGELRREQLVSRSIYDTDAALQTNFYRLFGNAEWRVVPSVVLNTGAMLERNSVSGDTFAPRVMVNWHLSPGQTLRYGASRAFRPPSTFENFGRQIYRSPQLAAAGFPNGEFVNFKSRGGLEPERLHAIELGYLGSFPSLHLDLDVRVFDENLTNIIKERKEANGYTKYYINTLGANYALGTIESVLNLHGLEYQLKWRPWDGGHFTMGQLIIDNGQLDPRSIFTSGWMGYTQNFKHGIHASVMLSHSDAVPEMPGQSVPGPAVNRIDVRVAKALRWGTKLGELAVVVQNLGPAYSDFIPNFYFRKQAFVVLKMDY